jgi:uncharacterized membrane protein
MHPHRKINIAVLIIIIMALTGFTDAVYLTVKHYVGELPVCTVVAGCEEVALSKYSTIAGVPISLLGTLFYLTVLIVSVAWFDTKKYSLLQKLPLITVPAFMFSIWLMYLMFAEIEALCIYCLLSAATSTIIMAISIWIIYKMRTEGYKKATSD